MSEGAIVYSAIADKEGLICRQRKKEFAFLDNVVGVVLSNANYDSDDRKVFSGHEKTNGCSVQYMVEDGLCFLSASTQGIQQRICFSFLNAMKEEWLQNNRGKTRSPSFEKQMREDMEFYTSSPDADKLRKVQDKVNQVGEIMQENMQQLLARSEANAELQEKAEQMKDKTVAFHKAAKQARCKTCVQSWCPICCCCYCCCRPCWQNPRCADCTIL